MGAMENQLRLIKKYPNRRLYDTKTSSYITLADVKQMVLKQEEFQVVDAKSGDDLTRQIQNNLADLKPLINFGASPRGSINLATAAKCYAFIKRRGYVIPEDVRAVVYDVLRHRIGITYEAEAENVTSEDIINKIVNEIEVP